MSNNIWDNFYWESTAANTYTTASDLTTDSMMVTKASLYDSFEHQSQHFNKKYQNNFDEESEQIQEQRMIREQLKSACNLKSIKPPECIQKMTDDLDLDFNRQMKNKDTPEPQNIFHFDPKDVVKEWPEKKI